MKYIAQPFRPLNAAELEIASKVEERDGGSILAGIPLAIIERQARVAYTRNGDFTMCTLVRLVAHQTFTEVAAGASKRSRDDADNPAIGQAVAFRRAVTSLSY